MYEIYIYIGYDYLWQIFPIYAYTYIYLKIIMFYK